MKAAKESKTEYESVKIKKDIVDRVRANKALTGVPVSVFFEMAAEDKLPAKSIIVTSEYASAMAKFISKSTNATRNNKRK